MGLQMGSLFNQHFQKNISSFPPNHKSARGNGSIDTAKLDKEIQKDRVRDPFDKPPFNNFVCSTLWLVPKKESGQFRLIYGLSYPKGNSVNSCIAS